MANGSLAEEIRHRLGECTPAERKVARVLLAGWPAAGFETVAALAERAAVSGPTVLRLIARLGYRGLPDFQTALRTELDERNASPADLYRTGGFAGEPRTTAALTGGGAASAVPALIPRAAEIFTKEITRTLVELPPHDLTRAVELLADGKRRITLCGGRFTQLLAHYLGLHLMQLRDAVALLPERSVERTAAISAMGRRDVLVVFDYRRYEPDKLAIANAVQGTGATIILFTDAWLSPVAMHADVVLPSQVGAPSPYDSLLPTLAIIETVIAGMVTALGEAGHEHVRRFEDAAERFGLY